MQYTADYTVTVILRIELPIEADDPDSAARKAKMMTHEAEAACKVRLKCGNLTGEIEAVEFFDLY